LYALKMPDLLPLFLNLTGRPVLLVGGGVVAAGKCAQLVAAGADVHVVAPRVSDAIRRTTVRISAREFDPRDLDGVWLVVAAAAPAVNRHVAAAASERRLFVNAVDDPTNASAYMGGVVRRGRVAIAVSTNGHAPALASLLREALEALLPPDLARWMAAARDEREAWLARAVPIAERKPLLLAALNRLYGAPKG
jgi:uroporphyrin-III C-methyltransferase/precorrin-2 dehydrogenase/sirohydrochlorin ferrochelatase